METGHFTTPQNNDAFSEKPGSQPPQPSFPPLESPVDCTAFATGVTGPESSLLPSETWQRLQSFTLDEPNVPLPFSKRLAEKQSWTPERTALAFEEYKRFALLTQIDPNVVAPTAIDEVWQSHLQFSRNYCDVFCEEVLKAPLHHPLLSGGEQEFVERSERYQHTRTLYERVFGEIPPAEIWPESYQPPLSSAVTSSDAPERAAATLHSTDPHHQQLWARLCELAFDDPDAEIPFSAQLATRNNWTQDYALTVLEEYRKFLFIGAVDGPVTPSLNVDEAWHYHLQDTLGYYLGLCEETLGKDFHHHPGNGEPASEEHFQRQYYETLGKYFRYFREDPPQRVWGEYVVTES